MKNHGMRQDRSTKRFSSMSCIMMILLLATNLVLPNLMTAQAESEETTKKRAEVAVAEKEVAEAQQQVEDAKKQVEEAEKKLAEAEAQHRDAKKELREAQDGGSSAEVTAAEKKVEQALFVREEAQKELLEAQADLEDAESELRKAEKRFEDAQQSLTIVLKERSTAEKSEEIIKQGEEYFAKAGQNLEQAETNIESVESGKTSNVGCLIATATFGSEMAPEVQYLRETRDNVVMQTQSGKAFMNTFNSVYYSFSPTVADWERQNPAFKEAVKVAITPLLATLSILNYANIDSETEMLAYGISVILLNIGMYFVAPVFAIARLKNH